MITRITKVCVRYVHPTDDEGERARETLAELQARSIVLAAAAAEQNSEKSAQIRLDCSAPPCPHVGVVGRACRRVGRS